jgi:hypothetical protein
VVDSVPDIIASTAVEKPSKLIYIAGQTPADDNYQPLHSGDVRAQYVAVLEGLMLQLKAAGATWDDVVFRRMYALDVPAFLNVLNDKTLPIPWDASRPWLRARQYGDLPAELTSIPDHDWAGFARSLGAQGFTVRDPGELDGVFQKALAAGTTAVIDVKADKNCPTPVYDFNAGAPAWSYHE